MNAKDALKIGIDRAMQRLSGIPRAVAAPTFDKTNYDR